MRIAYVTDQIYLHGGAEKILIQKLNYWAGVYGYEVLLITLSQKGRAPFFPVNPKVAHVDLAIEYPEGSLYHPRNIGRFVKQYRDLKRVLHSYRPDAVFVISQTLFRIITPFSAKPFASYFEYHTSWEGFKQGFDKLTGVRRLKETFIRAVQRFAEARYTKVVYLNQTEFDNFNRANAVVIPNFYDESGLIASSGRKNVAITLGRLSFEKQYDLLIESWALLDKEITGWELHIYGNGVEKQRLEKLLERTALRNPARLFSATDSVNEKLSSSSVYVLSSQVETFPMALLEALSNGLPVVSFDCPSGPRHIVTDGEDGILVEPQNTAALASALLRLMQNPDLSKKMGEAASHNVRRFNADAVMRQWDDLIKQHME